MLRFFSLGLVFCLALIKGEATSWFRMQEMFRFEGFQIFGFFMTAVPVAALCVWLIRKYKIKTADGEEVYIPAKKFHGGYIIGSALFGIGWGLTGACPGPIFVQIGSGFSVSIILLLSALAGTWVYSYFRNKLPHHTRISWISREEEAEEPVTAR
jgi:uncharacterized membrane protein YedE/YeeE